MLTRLFAEESKAIIGALEKCLTMFLSLFLHLELELPNHPLIDVWKQEKGSLCSVYRKDATIYVTRTSERSDTNSLACSDDSNQSAFLHCIVTLDPALGTGRGKSTIVWTAEIAHFAHCCLSRGLVRAQRKHIAVLMMSFDSSNFDLVDILNVGPVSPHHRISFHLYPRPYSLPSPG